MPSTPTSKPASNPTDRAPMVNWFSPRQLSRTGLLAVLSDIFGAYADRREMEAALTPELEINCDWEKAGEVRLDFISDLGEGWDSTYSMAYLLAQEQLTLPPDPANPGGQPISLPRADIVLVGGDLVYPTPTAAEYKRRFVTPYETAFPGLERPQGEATVKVGRPQLFAIPGNHDWYDGLGAFLKLMCQQRDIGNWQTRQQRSYFAIKLPYNWWVWGIDIQLHAEIDEPQKEYFRQACQRAQEGDKVILLTAEPAWIYPGYKTNLGPWETLQFFCEEFITKPGSGQPKMRLPLILSGDLHHYASYQGEDPVTGEPEWRIAAGGGGAFLHPTHQLKPTLEMPNDGPVYKGNFYPSQSISRWLTVRNLGFPVHNWSFIQLLLGVHLLFAWAVLGTEVHSVVDPQGPAKLIPEVVNELWRQAGSTYWTLIGRLILTRPWVMLIPILLFAGLYQFTDITTTAKNRARLLGIGHSLVQLLALLIVPIGFVMLYDFANWEHRPWLAVGGVLVLALLGALVGGLLMGLYLMISLLWLHTHENEAYSSLRIADYKNFLRMHLTEQGLEIHAVGLEKVSRKWKVSNHGAVSQVAPEEELAPHLIERHFIKSQPAAGAEGPPPAGSRMKLFSRG